MNDPFAQLGLPRKFDLDDAALSAAQQKGNDDAYQAIADPATRAQTLLALMDGPTKEFWRGTPSDFDAALKQAGNDPEKLAALQQQRLLNISNLFRQILGSNDKGPVQAGRQRMVRAELNALDVLTPLMQ